MDRRPGKERRPFLVTVPQLNLLASSTCCVSSGTYSRRFCWEQREVPSLFARRKDDRSLEVDGKIVLGDICVSIGECIPAGMLLVSGVTTLQDCFTIWMARTSPWPFAEDQPQGHSTLQLEYIAARTLSDKLALWRVRGHNIGNTCECFLYRQGGNRNSSPSLAILCIYPALPWIWLNVTEKGDSPHRPRPPPRKNQPRAASRWAAAHSLERCLAYYFSKRGHLHRACMPPRRHPRTAHARQPPSQDSARLRLRQILPILECPPCRRLRRSVLGGWRWLFFGSGNCKPSRPASKKQGSSCCRRDCSRFALLAATCSRGTTERSISSQDCHGQWWRWQWW